MIRISFETLMNSDDLEHPQAWRREASARLREIAKRIATGEAMRQTGKDQFLELLS